MTDPYDSFLMAYIDRFEQSKNYKSISQLHQSLYLLKALKGSIPNVDDSMVFIFNRMMPRLLSLDHDINRLICNGGYLKWHYNPRHNISEIVVLTDEGRQHISTTNIDDYLGHLEFAAQVVFPMPIDTLYIYSVCAYMGNMHREESINNIAHYISSACPMITQKIALRGLAVVADLQAIKNPDHSGPF